MTYEEFSHIDLQKTNDTFEATSNASQMYCIATAATISLPVTSAAKVNTKPLLFILARIFSLVS